MFKRYFTSLLFVVYIEHLGAVPIERILLYAGTAPTQVPRRGAFESAGTEPWYYRAYVRKHTQTVGEVFHELTVCGILIYNKKKEANMGDNISELEQEDILNALDAGRMIGTESSRRVLSQVEIDKIVDAYNELVESKENLLELMGIAEELNKSENTRTVFTQKCVDYIPVVLRTIEALR